jgi:O-antigen/teichoic acid export membrane protein
MNAENLHKGRRIAKNTMMLYVRMFVLMLVGLYTSRVVLSALGETDYGVYSVVGGVVAMFSMISGALNSAVSRFITFELGKGDPVRLNKVYCTSVNIQLMLGLIVVLLVEPIGLWFLENKMTIDPARIPAATWVLHLSLLAFVVNLMSVPQMAAITAHEKMSAYAYIGILDGLLRLGVAFMIISAPFDRLVYYAMLMALVVLIVRITYGIYCRIHFPECRYHFIFDRPLVKEMFSFAGWNFIGVTSGVLRDYGGNILVNLFSGPVVNAARGIAVQLNGAVQSFVTNFMTAVNPQITKSYAAGDTKYVFALIGKSSRMSFYLLSLMAIPIIFNANLLLQIWLKEVPEHTTLFVQLFLIFAMGESLSLPLITAMLATGRIRNYQLVVGGIQLLNLPISYILLKLGAIPEITVVVAIALSHVCLFARLIMFSRASGFSVPAFVRGVYVNALKVAIGAASIPLLLTFVIPQGILWSVLHLGVSLLWTAGVIFFIGCSKEDRAFLYEFIGRRAGK